MIWLQNRIASFLTLEFQWRTAYRILLLRPDLIIKLVFRKFVLLGIACNTKMINQGGCSAVKSAKYDKYHRLAIFEIEFYNTSPLQKCTKEIQNTCTYITNSLQYLTFIVYYNKTDYWHCAHLSQDNMDSAQQKFHQVAIESKKQKCICNKAKQTI